ncbi:homoserine kinase [Alteribacillus iranensis]|uniref:Homoserine kinase n=1 Tax=Alteribacillus iranensis TaxID=930128 RepID=A0A1I2EQQ1_9BACI|nr:homoserine kinase [Alteribacillus iranensis]SFE94788.1 homoserine kinase [Alteribacillus iranensis]
MAGKKIVITVPASSANLGPGFDSIGLAVNKYLTLEAERADEWSFHSNSAELANMPSGKDNLVYQTALRVSEDLGVTLPPCNVRMTSDIPLARGLGSSAAAIVAAIELANWLTGASLTKEEKMRYASREEGHPDNVGPCLYGGLIIGLHTETSTDIVRCGVPDVDLVLAIPSAELMTKEARGVLPDRLEYQEAIQGSAIGNVLTAALLKEDWDLAGRMMAKDLFHQPYRAKLVPGLTEILENARKYGAYGAALSGAGPTLMCLVPYDEGEKVREALQRDFPQYSIQTAKPAPFGSVVRFVNENRSTSMST